MGRRVVPDADREEVCKRLREAERPDCSEIARQMTAEGRPVSTSFVWSWALRLGIELPGPRRGRKKGSKNREQGKARGPYKLSGKPRKERTNTLYSPHRDEVLRLVAEGVPKAEIARRLGIMRSWVYGLLESVSPEELQALTDDQKKISKEK